MQPKFVDPKNSNIQGSVEKSPDLKKSVRSSETATPHVHKALEVNVEASLAKFLGAYSSYLNEMSQFATPILVHLLRVLQKIPEDIRGESPIAKETWQKALDELDAKTQYFSNKFDALPIPANATMIRTQPYDFPLTNLFVFRIDYDSFILTFMHTNKRIDLGEQTLSVLSGSALPGSTLWGNVDLWLKKPISPVWKWTKPQLFKPQYDKDVMYHHSEEGHVEREMSTERGKFWSPESWSARASSKIEVEPSNNFRAPPFSIGNARFKPSTVGSGELDAFLRYVQTVPVAEFRKFQQNQQTPPSSS